MPIDDAMQYELVDAWLPKFLCAVEMSASHPLKEAVIAEAEREVMDSYRAQAKNDTGLNKVYDGIAADVIAILWGVASYIQESTGHYQQDRGSDV